MSRSVSGSRPLRTFPAILLALTLPALRDQGRREPALVGAVIALAATPFLPVGPPVLLALAGLAVTAIRGGPAHPQDTTGSTGSTDTAHPADADVPSGSPSEVPPGPPSDTSDAATTAQAADAPAAPERGGAIGPSATGGPHGAMPAGKTGRPTPEESRGGTEGE